MNVIVIICSIIVFVMLLWSIFKEEQYKNLYEEEKDENKLLRRKIEKIDELIILNDTAPVKERNSYTTMREIKEVIGKQRRYKC